MIAVDTNILIYAHREDSPFHVPALCRVAELANGTASWAIPWTVGEIHLRITGHRQITIGYVGRGVGVGFRDEVCDFERDLAVTVGHRGRGG